jgi:putative transposase
MNKEAFDRDDLKKFKWAADVPYDVRDEAMNDVLKAYKSNLAKGVKFDIKLRSKKDKQQSVALLNKHWLKKKRVFSFLRTINSAEALPQDLGYDSRLIKTRTGHYYLCELKPLEARSESQAPVFNETQKSKGAGVIAIDLGVLTFNTWFDPGGLIAEWEVGEKARLGRLCHAYNSLQGRWSQKQVKHCKRYRMKKAGLRIQLKIRNLVDELHKMFKRLCSNYRLILLTSFGTKQMVRRLSRNISGETVRAMLTWAHYRFRKRLLFKSQEYPWCKVIICSEAYTSITCVHCGKLNRELGKNKIFECPSCCCILDRDV